MIMHKPLRPIPSRVVAAAVPVSCVVVGAILATAAAAAPAAAAAAAARRGSAPEHCRGADAAARDRRGVRGRPALGSPAVPV
jgi:hypothetical protein